MIDMSNSQVTLENYWATYQTQNSNSTTFHPQSNGQTKVVNRTLENLLRTLIGEHIGNWDLNLAIAEFPYNTYVNRTTGKSPDEIVYDFRLKQHVDLISLSYLYRAPEYAF